jgi:hypoxanthine phosphoribosyltransferase
VTRAGELEELVPAARVRSRISELAEQMARDFDGAPFVIVRIDEGARRFVGALERQLGERGIAPEVRPIRVRRTRGMALQDVQVEAFDPDAFEGRDVLVVDDIADEGETLRAVLDLLAGVETRTVRTAVLVDKRTPRRGRLPLDYVGFELEGGWVVGFGMDLDGAYRELDAIAVVVDRRF